jgi:hypothetical protein
LDDPLRAPLGFLSDVDGDQYAVIDASLADLAGWKLETHGPDEVPETEKFVRGTHYGGPTGSCLTG